MARVQRGTLRDTVVSTAPHYAGNWVGHTLAPKSRTAAACAGTRAAMRAGVVGDAKVYRCQHGAQFRGGLDKNTHLIEKMRSFRSSLQRRRRRRRRSAEAMPLRLQNILKCTRVNTATNPPGIQSGILTRAKKCDLWGISDKVGTGARVAAGTHRATGCRDTERTSRNRLSRGASDSTHRWPSSGHSSQKQDFG